MALKSREKIVKYLEKFHRLLDGILVLILLNIVRYIVR